MQRAREALHPNDKKVGAKCTPWKNSLNPSPSMSSCMQSYSIQQLPYKNNLLGMESGPCWWRVWKPLSPKDPLQNIKEKPPDLFCSLSPSPHPLVPCANEFCVFSHGHHSPSLASFLQNELFFGCRIDSRPLLLYTLIINSRLGNILECLVHSFFNMTPPSLFRQSFARLHNFLAAVVPGESISPLSFKIYTQHIQGAEVTAVFILNLPLLPEALSCTRIS